MKGKSSQKKPSEDISIKTSASNLFLNLIIIILSILIVFLGYSLFIKITGAENLSVSNEELAAEVIQLEVLNGCGASGIAEKLTNFLRRKNFDVVQSGNYISFDIDKSMVIDRTGNMANAYKVAETLGIDKKNVIRQINDDYFLDVSLIIGRDYFQLISE